MSRAKGAKPAARDGRRPSRKTRRGAAKRPRAVETALAALAHEVRTPLNGILALGELLAASDLPERERGWAAAVKSAAERLYIELAKPFDRYERCALDSRIAGWRGAVSYKPCRYNRVAHAHNHQHAARIVRRVVGHCGSASRWHRLDRADRKIVKLRGMGEVATASNGADSAARTDLH